MSLASDAAVFFRTQWPSRFVDAVTIRRTTVRGALNVTSGLYDAPTVAVVYGPGVGDGGSDLAGGALIRPAGARDVDFGQVEQHRGAFDVHLPHTAIDIEVEDRITVDTVDAGSDPDLVGAVLVVTSAPKDSYLTHRTLGAELDQGTGNP